MPRMNKLSNYRTAIFMCDGWQCVVYAETIIVRWNDDTILLNTGGWKSVTTKRKMNQASRQFNLGYAVYQKDYCWFLRVFERDAWERWDELATEYLFDNDSISINRKTRNLSL